MAQGGGASPPQPARFCTTLHWTNIVGRKIRAATEIRRLDLASPPSAEIDLPMAQLVGARSEGNAQTEQSREVCQLSRLQTSLTEP